MRLLKATVALLLIFAIKNQARATGNTPAWDPSLSLADTVLTFKPLPEKRPDEKCLFFTLGGWYNRKTGSSDIYTSNGEATLEYDNNITMLYASGKFFYTRTNQKMTEQRGDGIVRFDHAVFSRFELFVFTHSEYNYPARLEHRNSTGGGIKCTFIENQFLRFDTSGAPVYEYQNIQDQRYTNQARWSFRFRLLFVPIQPLSMQAAYFFMPRIDDANRYRLNLDAWLGVEILKNLSFRVGYINQYNTEPPAGVPNADTITYCKLLINW